MSQEEKQIPYRLGDNETSITFLDRTWLEEKKLRRISIIFSGEADFEKFFVKKKDAIELRDWLNKLIEKEGW